MNVLRTVLDGKRSEGLTYEETQTLFREPIPTLTERSKFLLYVEKALERKIIKPDVLLIVATSGVKTIADLNFVSIALRNGANPNLYVASPTLGKVHIIVYTVSTLKASGTKISLILTTVLVLLMMGSLSTSNAYDQSTESKAPIIDSLFVDDIASTLSLSPSSTKPKPKPIMIVQEWLRSQGLPPFDAPLETTLSELKRETRATLNVITDRVVVDEKHTPNLEDVLAARASNNIVVYPLARSDQEHGEFILLQRCIECLNSKAYTHFLELGLHGTYFTINRLIFKLRKYNTVGNTVAVSEVVQMLQSSVERGSHIDMEQLAVISTTNAAIAQNILDAYRRPHWKKVCTSPSLGPTPDSLKTLAFTLGMDTDVGKDKLCTDLTMLSEADAASLKNAAILRQKSRTGSTISTISEFITGSVPVVGCANKTILQSDPFEYNDAYMSFYKDGGGKVWCFTSNMYESLLAKPINPHTSTPLPDSFLSQIRSHLDILRRLGLSPTDPHSITSAIDELSVNDEVSGKESTYIVDTIMQAAKVAGVDPTVIKAMTPLKMNQVLSTIGMNRDELLFVDTDKRPTMTPDHRIITFSRAAYHIIKERSDQARIFFNNIKL